MGLDALCSDGVDGIPETAPEEIFDFLKPEFQDTMSPKEIHKALHIISSNRFGTRVGNLELMFAGSLFEHSCKPNCFHGTWDIDDTATWTPKNFRALCEVSEGTALSIDYLLLPDAYASTEMRQKELGRWGFQCTCERCTTLPELTRAFVCPACGKGELCPSKPDSDDDFVCLSCGKQADPEVVSRCLAVEAEFIETLRPPPMKGHDVISRYHWLSFAGAWRHFMNPEAWMAVPRKANIIVCHLLVDCISRLYGTVTHPCLVEIFNELAKLYGSDDLDTSGYFLAMEHEALQASYPEESCRQDKEALAMCQRQGPPSQIIKEMEEEGLDVMHFDPSNQQSDTKPGGLPLEDLMPPSPKEEAISREGTSLNGAGTRAPLVFGGAASAPDRQRVSPKSDLSGMD